jgi:hypothetical protein
MILFLHSLLYGTILLLVVQNQLLLAALAALLFTYYRSAAWLIPLGFLVDGYFDAFYAVPMFSIITIIWFIISELLKPRLRGYAT